VKIGYIKVSSVSQGPKLQHDALEAFGCKRLYADISVDDNNEQPELSRMLGHLKPDDIVVVWQIDRLSSSRRRLFQLIESFEDRNVGFVSLQDNLDTTVTGGIKALRKFLQWYHNEDIPAGTALVYARIQGYGDVKIEKCRTGIDDLDKVIEEGVKLVGCDPEEGYPGLDAANCLIHVFGGEILRVEYGPLPDINERICL
jgi:hypothetical protein